MHVRELRVCFSNRRIPARLCTDALTTPKGAGMLLAQILGSEIVEVCGVLCLSTTGALIVYHELSRGTLDTTIVHPRDVFRTAILSNAGSIVIGHNHPSGVVRPSPDDVALTRRLAVAADVMGITLADHVIVNASGAFFSFREASML